MLKTDNKRELNNIKHLRLKHWFRSGIVGFSYINW